MASIPSTISRRSLRAPDAPATGQPPFAEAGLRVGRWVLRAPLGAGAFGVTWRAVRDDGLVGALKLLGTPPGDELRVLSRLCHPAIPMLLDHGGSRPAFVVTELVEGAPIVLSAPRTAEGIEGVGASLLDALAAVHQTGHAHGDVKPENVLVSHDDNCVHLIDFGLSDSKGGTLAWAAPERLRGEPARPPADVYAVGLMLYALLHGALPWSELPVGEAAARREAGAPEVRIGPPWLRQLVKDMLQPDPSLRPTAERAADRFTDQGVPLPKVDAALLRRRARVVRVARPEVDGALEHWLERGGALLLVGPRGSGRSAVLRHMALELRAQGRQVLRMIPGEGPWGAVLSGLHELGLDLPPGPDNWTRAQRLGRQLAADGVVVLVDNISDLDPDTARIVEQVVSLRGALLAASGHSQPGFRSELRLSPLDGDRLGQLAELLVGYGADQPQVRRALWEASRGHPADAVAFLIGCVTTGALRRERRALLWDPTLVPGPEATSGSVILPPPASDAGRVAAALSLSAGGLPVATLAPVCRVGLEAVDRAIDELVSLGVISFGEGYARVERRLRPLVLRGRDDLDGLRRDLLAYLLRSPETSADLICELAIELGAPALIEQHGASGVIKRLARDPFGAERLAARLWELGPTPALAVARLRAMVASGRSGDAQTFGEELFPEDRAVGPDAPMHLIDAMVELASLCARQLGQLRLAGGWVSRARVALGARPAPPSLDVVEASVCQSSGDPARARLLASPIALAEPPTGFDELDLFLRARVVLAQATQAEGDLNGALELLSDIPPDLGRGRGARALLDGSRGRFLWMAGRYAEADAAMMQAGENDAGLAVVDRARLLNNLGALRYQAGDRAGAVLVWEQARALFEQLDARMELVRALANLCVGYRELGRWERAREAGERSLSGARELDAADLECNAQLNLGTLDMARGRLIEAEDRFAAAQALAEEADAPQLLTEARVRRAEIATLREQPEALEMALVADQEAQALGMVTEGCLAAALVSCGLARGGRPWTEVEPYTRRALDPLQKNGAAGDLAQCRLWVAEALTAAQEHQRARTVLEKVRVYAREQGDIQLALRADNLDARIAAHWADPDRDARLEKMISLAVAINEATQLDDVLNQIARAGLDLVSGERAFVLLGDPPELLASAFVEGAHGAPAASVVGQAMRDRKEVIAADVDERADLRTRQSVVSLELRSVLCVPLLHHEKALGVLYVDSRTASQRHLWNCALVMRGLAALAAVAVVRAHMHAESVRQAREAAKHAERLRNDRALREKNAELQTLNEQLRLAAITDPLTGLFNRRHLSEVLAPLHWEATQTGSYYGVLLLDIDHFKRVNDTWGHPAGDLVIQRVAGVLRQTARDQDLAFRYGGEELLVLVKDVEMDALVAFGERLRQGICARPFEVCPGERHPVTVSIGAAIVHPAGDVEWDSVLQRADNALYEAKRGGRNRVVGHQFGQVISAAVG